MELKVPPSIVGYSDGLQVLRALDNREAAFIAAEAAGRQIPANSNRLLEDLASVNNINLMDRLACSQLKKMFGVMLDKLPQLHISFAVEPSAEVLRTILVWLRSNIHPGVLLSVGLQPSIAAGCVLRTPNKIFDFSLRAYINQQDKYLLQLIKGAISGR